MVRPQILIAGVGNIFLGDDAFGVAVAQRLQTRELPAGVEVVDFGIRGFDLACAILDGYDGVILVDATTRGHDPGTLSVIDPDVNDANESPLEQPTVEPHGLHPVQVLRLAQELGGLRPPIRMVGCEPATLAPGECIRLSGPVATAVDGAIELVESLISSFLRSAWKCDGVRPEDRGNQKKTETSVTNTSCTNSASRRRSLRLSPDTPTGTK